jgi:hypothetical protein
VRSDSARPVTLQFVPRESQLIPIPKTSDRPAFPETGGVCVQLSATMDGSTLRDTYNYVGFLDDENAGVGSFNYLEPPLLGDYLQLSIMKGTDAYMSDLRPPTASGSAWDLQLRSTVTRGQIRITVAESGTMPEGFDIHLFDLQRGSAIALMGDHFDVVLPGGGGPYRLRLVIGTLAYTQQNSEGIPLHPVEYALEQNYPNPFNPQTTIRYTLARKGEVKLAIYDLLGKRVRTLVDDERPAGEQVVVWDGSDDKHQPVGSGVYFCRMKSGDFAATRKLLLVR